MVEGQWPFPPSRYSIYRSSYYRFRRPKASFTSRQLLLFFFSFLLLSTIAQQRLDGDDDGVGGYRFVPVLVGFNDVGCAQGAKRARNVFQFLQPGRKGCDLESVITSATAGS
ncbi:hypothetical protein QL093DRAFT_2338657 [Fusarium oxysporum]|nr:hypothetical protein QL093DRAFT_2338657 [Fusarium oxysporum]